MATIIFSFDKNMYAAAVYIANSRNASFYVRSSRITALNRLLREERTRNIIEMIKPVYASAAYKERIHEKNYVQDLSHLFYFA